MSERTAHILEQKWRSDDIKIGEDADFSSLFLRKELLKGLKLSGFKYPSPIQLKAIPVGKIGKDLIVQAKSGTGKTLVFTVIALNMLMKEATHPQVLIMAPTREIACQISQVIKGIGFAYKDFACDYFIGGRRLEEDVPRIQGCQIIVGTPGRIKQMINCKILKTTGIRLFVLDEADQLLKESSFTTDIDDIFRALPRDKQMIATSATYPDKLKRLTNKYFRDPLLIRLNKNDIGLLGMVHYYYVIPVSKMPVVSYRKKLEFLEDVLLSVKFAQCLVFCNMVSRVENLCVEIKKWGFATSYISSAREQHARLKAIELLKKFKCKVLVSSDISSRGIDAENVDLVINFDLPPYLDVYFHRVGRAGRYGSKCASITFITSDEIEAYQQMQRDGKFKSYPLLDRVPKGLISMQPKMKCIVKDEELPCDDEIESSSDSRHDTEDLNEDGVVKHKANDFIEDIKLNGHNELCTSKVDEFISGSLANPSNEKLVDSEVESTESRVSQGMQNQVLNLNSNPTSSVKEDDDLSSTSESVELELDNTNSLTSVELELDNTNSFTSVKLKQEIGTEECSSTKIVAVENENDKLNVNESIGEESFENDQLVRSVLAQEGCATLVVEKIENYQSDKYPNNMHGLQQIIDKSSCLANIESISEKTIDVKSLVMNNDCNISKILNNPNSKELVSSALTFIKDYENLNKGVDDCFTADSTKSSRTVNVEPNDNKFSPISLEHLRSNLNKYQYNVFKDFVENIPEGLINEIAPECKKESVNQVSEIRVQHSLKQNDGENKIQCSSLDSRNVLFSTPKSEVASESKSGHSSGQDSSSGSDKDKLIKHFNLMVASIDKVKSSSNRKFTSESSSSSELNSDTSVNSRDAMYELTKEFNKMTQKGARGCNKKANKNMGKGDIINNSELSSSSSDSDSGTSIDSEKAADELEKEFAKLIKNRRNDGGSSKHTKETKKILQGIKGMKKCFKGIEIVDTKKHAESSSNTSDSDDVDTKKHAESSNSTSDSDISTDINKKKEVGTTKKSSKLSSNKQYKKTINVPAQNKITYYSENYVDQFSKKSPGLQGVHQIKIPKKCKTLQTKTIKGPVQNKITYYYSGSSSSETENDIEQYSTEPHSSLPVEIVDTKKHAESSSNTSSDSDDVDTKKHAESSNSSSDSDISTDINKRKEVGNTIMSLESSSHKQYKKTINGPAQNKITYSESYVDQYSKESPSGLQGDHQRKIHKKGKTLRAKTIKGPVQNKITNYYSGSSSSETENDIDRYSTEPHSNHPIEHQRKRKTQKKDETLSKAEPSRLNYSNANGTSSTYLNTASERQTFDPSYSYYQMQPTNYASNPYYQLFPQQIQNPANHGLFTGTHSHHMEPTSGTFNPHYQPYPQQIPNHANHGLFLCTKSGHQPTSYATNPYYQPKPSECPLKESCQMSKMQTSGSGHSAGNSNCQRSVQSNYQLQPLHAYNQCFVPSQHPCHPPNETCQSLACAAWYDIFYKQWQFLNQPPFY